VERRLNLNGATADKSLLHLRMHAAMQPHSLVRLKTVQRCDLGC